MTAVSLFGKLREHELQNTMSLLSRNVSKFLKKKDQASKRYSSKKPNDFNLNKYTCYGCGE